MRKMNKKRKREYELKKEDFMEIQFETWYFYQMVPQNTLRMSNGKQAF